MLPGNTDFPSSTSSHHHGGSFRIFVDTPYPGDGAPIPVYLERVDESARLSVVRDFDVVAMGSEQAGVFSTAKRAFNVYLLPPALTCSTRLKMEDIRLDLRELKEKPSPSET